jgi:hypothetical protein
MTEQDLIDEAKKVYRTYVGDDEDYLIWKMSTIGLYKVRVLGTSSIFNPVTGLSDIMVGGSIILTTNNDKDEWHSYHGAPAQLVWNKIYDMKTKKTEISFNLRWADHGKLHRPKDKDGYSQPAFIVVNKDGSIKEEYYLKGRKTRADHIKLRPMP